MYACVCICVRVCLCVCDYVCACKRARGCLAYDALQLYKSTTEDAPSGSARGGLCRQLLLLLHTSTQARRHAGTHTNIQVNNRHAGTQTHTHQR